MFIFPDRKNTENLPKILKICFYTGYLPPTQGKFLMFSKIKDAQGFKRDVFMIFSVNKLGNGLRLL